MNSSFLFTIALLFSLISLSCKEDTPTILSEVFFDGITETIEKGPEPIGKIDPDDWRAMMNCNSMPKRSNIVNTDTIGPIVGVPTCTRILPAYPNPAVKQFVIRYDISSNDSVVIVLNKSSTTIVKNILNQKLLAGSYTVNVDASDLTPGIYRVFISTHHNGTVLSSYGDVQIQK